LHAVSQFVDGSQGECSAFAELRGSPDASVMRIVFADIAPIKRGWSKWSYNAEQTLSSTGTVIFFHEE
jgi:hypothetical protein